MIRPLAVALAVFMLVGCSATEQDLDQPSSTVPPDRAEDRVTETPEPVESVTPAATPPPETTPTPAAPEPEAVWERYGSLPADLGVVTDDFYLSVGPMNCADIAAGKIETGWLHGFITGGNLPEYVKPQPASVYSAVRSVELSCPDLMDEFTALLDDYDAAHSPYPY